MGNFFANRKNTKKAVIAGTATLLIVALAAGTVYGLKALKDAEAPADAQAEETTVVVGQETDKDKTKKKKKEKATEESENKKAENTKNASKDKKKTDSLTCKLTVDCKVAVNNPDLDESKKKCVPANGIIYATRTVTFKKGESVYDVLKREMKNKGIQMASTGDYVKAINNLYEFDCGPTSGWKYKVNGSFPGFGSTKYKVKKGDNIGWVFVTEV